MRLVKKAGKLVAKMSKKEWLIIGEKAGWTKQADVMANLPGDISYRCPNCGVINLRDKNGKWVGIRSTKPKEDGTCWYCGADVPEDARID